MARGWKPGAAADGMPGPRTDGVCGAVAGPVGAKGVPGAVAAERGNVCRLVGDPKDKCVNGEVMGDARCIEGWFNEAENGMGSFGRVTPCVVVVVEADAGVGVLPFKSAAFPPAD